MSPSFSVYGSLFLMTTAQNNGPESGAMRRKARPLSPHLQVYKPQITSVMSILHRATGLLICLGLFVLTAWLVALATSQELYNSVMDLVHTSIGRYFLFCLSWAFFYHFCTGIRHILWDAGLFMKLPQVYSTGRIALGVSTLLTVLIWLKIFSAGVL